MLEIVPADLDRTEHVQGLLAILSAYAEDPMGSGRALPESVRAAVVPGLRAHPGAEILLAFREKRAVGLAVCFVGFSTFAARPVLNIHDLAVVPDARGRGVGRELLAAAQERASELGCCKLTLEVREDNDRARGLYKSFGFGHYAPGKEQTPTLFLEKMLPKDP